MDKILAELLSSAAAPLMEALKLHTEALHRDVEALTRNSDMLERAVAGQEAALAKIEGGSVGTAVRKRRTKAEMEAEAGGAEPTVEPAVAAVVQPEPETVTAVDPEPVHPLLVAPNSDKPIVTNPKTGVKEPTPTGDFRAADFSRDELKDEFVGWLGSTDDLSEKKKRAAFVGAVAQHFGVKQLFHATEGLIDDEQRKQTLFFLRRKREGLAVDFAADYDFDGDPMADQTVDEDEFDALGM